MGKNPDSGVPTYLERNYWWAYVRPWAPKVFDHGPIIDLILFGYYPTLRDAALEAFGDDLSGKTLKVSSCYGSLEKKLAEKVKKAGGTLDVIDISPTQIANSTKKLAGTGAIISKMDSTALDFPSQSFDSVLLFFLLHEQPQEIREQTVREALRVLKPNGKFVIVDYGQPQWWQPLRYLVLPWLTYLEPFAPDLWYRDLLDVVPGLKTRAWKKTSYCGGLYQRMVSE
jgi:ubiquinone/menaquinone biosynthesis C-methylase UbiE